MIPQTIIRIIWGVIATLPGPGWFEFCNAPANTAPNISHIGSPYKYAESMPTVQEWFCDNGMQHPMMQAGTVVVTP
ncbi:hypothetical protein CEXT_563071 [Caerostris extrusa]|uniref:Uncharacterized protein n=1 Tax=Caerostris extrusa TaxID=172846 RepID=A0AAV4WMT4_CAEEX|nr:hypothetical protein CEXT_563071 [Caerostris extrusa]